MHEMSIIVHVADTLEKAAEENGIVEIGSVTLQIGEVSGIVWDYFEDCWNFFKRKHPLLKNSVLKIEEIPAVTYCSNCGRTYPTVQYGKTCPYCGSGETWLETGNQCVIKEIEARTGDAPPEPYEEDPCGTEDSGSEES
jgi:hydrogenase nickel incorporation protein HypA/HybF